MNAFELFGTIAINNEEATSALDEVSTKGKNLASRLSSTFATAGKVIVKGAAAGAAAIGALAVASVKTYADYEQLVGGVETLFKDSSDAVMEYANNAYKTAGLSANEYMSTVTSFSASLLQGLGGDTAAAANIANVAITDMADNANKIGTSMELIQNAYQGFAKQNYTMLDNLKLGYGGTASEMARLINDSGVLGDAFKATAENLREIPFDKQIEAIHAIQEEMGITGTTAMEASETISGSWASMGAAWKNLLVGISDDTQNLDLLISNFSDSVIAVFQNIAERIPSILKGLIGVVTGLFGELFDYISLDLLNTGLSFDSFVEKIQEVFNKIASHIDAAVANWNEFKVNLSANWEELKGKASEVWENIKLAMTQPVEDAKNTIKGIVEKIKGFFDFEWSLPPIKLPHFSISGSFSLNPLSVPKISVSWYKKGGILNAPTIFGAMDGKLLGGGEGGEPEAVSPISVLQYYVAEAVAGQNAGIISALDRVVEAIHDMHGDMGESMRGALDGVSVGVNKREFGRLVKAVT